MRPVQVLRPDGTGVVARVEDATVRLGGAQILVEASLEVRAGQVHALVGPNGAGKSTLLGVLAGDVRLAAGRASIHGVDVSTWHPRELARARAALLQQTAVSFPFTVEDVVRMGRAPWAGTPAEDDDDRAVAAALADTDVAHLRARTFPTLSGGERARAALARALAQDAPLLLLDEPTAALDLGHQESVLRIAQEQARRGRAVVVVLHDLGLAAAHADRVTILARGRVVAAGDPRSVLTADRLSAVYGHPVEVLEHPRDGSLIVLPLRG